jgi:hypothetical protein
MSPCRKRGRRLAAVAVAGALVAIAVAPALEPTDAAWTDGEHATAALTALRLQPPHITTITECRNRLVLGPIVEAHWEWPDASFPHARAASNTQWRISIAGGAFRTINAETTESPGGGYTSRLHGSLLNGLLGTNAVIEVHTVWTPAGGVQWTSPQATHITATMPLLVGPGTCVASNGN